MAKTREVLTSEDVEVLKASMDNANIFLDYYFGVQLQPHQLYMAHMQQPSLLLLGGRGSGKTYGFIWKYVWLATVMPDLRVLWGSYSADQAAIPFYDVAYPSLLASERFMKFLPEGEKSLKRKPHPQIQIKVPGTKLPMSTITFKTIGMGANTKRGFTLDIIHYDEAGLENNEKVITTLRPAMRGRRWNGDPRLAQLAVSTTPTSAEWLREWWNRATNQDHPDYDPKKYFALKVSSSANTALTPEQLEAFAMDMTPEEQQVELQADFPEYTGTDFSPAVVNLCQDRTLNQEVVDAIEEKRTGYDILTIARTGIVKYVKPAVPGRKYILAGDPGMGNPPYRNAPCVMVWDVTERPYELVCFYWVFGNGSYKPFFNRYEWALDYYQPLFAVFDSTGTQRAMDELYFEDRNRIVEGLNLQSEKSAMLNAAKILMQRGDLRFPYIQGLRLQLLNYKQEEDKKIAQDLVVTLAMAAWKMRVFSYQPPDDIGEDELVDDRFLNGRSDLRDADRVTGRSL